MRSMHAERERERDGERENKNAPMALDLFRTLMCQGPNHSGHTALNVKGDHERKWHVCVYVCNCF